MSAVPCRLCAEPLIRTFVDLGMSPLCENFLRPDQLDARESFYPLHVRICSNCLLVQLPAYVPGEEIFSDYAYFSSYSDSYVEHQRQYAQRMIAELGLTKDSLVTEVASNDGYLLQHFVSAGVPVLGVEPASNIVEVARAKGIRTENQFLTAETGAALAEQYGRADLVAANNVYAHIPDLIGFTAGLAALVKPEGLVTIEVQHLLTMMRGSQYDTIYHEHYHYLTLLTAQRALATAGLVVTDVELIGTHGGSLRIFARPSATAGAASVRVKEVLELESDLHTVEGHMGFASSVFGIKSDLVKFLLAAKAEGKRVVGYGAPGKGNTLLNHCGVRSDLLEYTVDRNPHKHGMFLPGTHIPIHDPSRIGLDKPDYILVLPWNLRTELTAQLSYVREWGGRLVFPIPSLEIA
ncbi:MAG TPA: SAM-dependent methyltransferase [Micromonosporaceae bacterium]|nr:SAM-dependent methyltransferase [Micromonosporaceae bacterium]